MQLKALPYRSIQIGLSGEAVNYYVNDWIQDITEITPLARQIRELVEQNRLDEAQTLLPPEQPYLAVHVPI